MKTFKIFCFQEAESEEQALKDFQEFLNDIQFSIEEIETD